MRLPREITDLKKIAFIITVDILYPIWMSVFQLDHISALPKRELPGTFSGKQPWCFNFFVSYLSGSQLFWIFFFSFWGKSLSLRVDSVWKHIGSPKFVPFCKCEKLVGVPLHLKGPLFSEMSEFFPLRLFHSEQNFELL